MFLLAHAATLAHTVLWNSPWPSYCNQSVVDPQPDFSKFGVTANANNSFNGDAVTVIYCPTHFSLFPHIETLPNGTLNMVNGGIPQRGDMKAHLIKVANDIRPKLRPLDLLEMGRGVQPVGERRYAEHAGRHRQDQHLRRRPQVAHPLAQLHGRRPSAVGL